MTAPSSGIRPKDPAVAASAEVKPALEPRNQSRAYCATPMERHDFAAKPFTPAAGRQTEVNVCRTVTASRCTIETGYTVDVRELVYPGGPTDFVPVEGKWVYVFREQKLAVEAFAEKPGVWSGVTIEGSRRKRWRTGNGVRVDPGPSGARHAYFFFLSPVQLTRGAIEYLEQGGKLDLAAVRCLCGEYGATVFAPDPLRWAADAQARYHAPRVDTLRAWQYDEDMVACAFVAGVLQAWIDDGDRAGVANELQRRPKDWLDARKKGMEEALRKAEEAAAYLGHCVDAPEYYAIERSCRERGGDDLALGAVALACVTSDLLATDPGKRLAQQLASDPERLPRHLLFQDEREALPQEWFERHRFGEKALLGIFNDLLPAVIQLTIERGKGLRAAEDQRDRIRRYLENLRIKTTLKAPQAKILANLQQGRKISAGAPRGSKGWRAIQGQWSRLQLVEEVRKGAPTNQEVIAERWSRRLEPFSAVQKGLGWTVGSAVELANVLNAYEALREATPEQQGDKARAVIGAWSDLLEHGGGLVEDLVKHCGWKRALKGSVGVFAFIGSALDMVEFEGQLVDALGEYDYGKAVGRGLQVAGAATSAVGGAMVLAGAIYGGSLGPVGALVGAIGGVLVAVGFVVAAWLAHNANEKFATLCFLGNESGETAAPAPLEWSEVSMPTARPTVEARALTELLAQFQVVAIAGLSPWSIHIQPGLLESSWNFEVSLHSEWRNWPAQDYRVLVDLAADVAVQTEGKVDLKTESRIVRDQDGRVTGIDICVDDAKEPESRLRQFQVVRARVRLVIDAKLRSQVPKTFGTAVEVYMGYTGRPAKGVHSLDPAACKPLEEAR